MFDIGIESLGADGLFAHVVEVRAVAEQAEVRTLDVAAAWADLHGVVEAFGPALPGAERLVQFGGDGTPETCEFCPAELGAEMGMSPEAAAMLIGDALPSPASSSGDHPTAATTSSTTPAPTSSPAPPD